ncbi:hypothetical protein J6590_066436 [Homalodisca vitripennis]|nr:hypothetical protein J6590_066436 [Homalodisca vitripennis]
MGQAICAREPTGHLERGVFSKNIEKPAKPARNPGAIWKSSDGIRHCSHLDDQFALRQFSRCSTGLRSLRPDTRHCFRKIPSTLKKDNEGKGLVVRNNRTATDVWSNLDRGGPTLHTDYLGASHKKRRNNPRQNLDGRSEVRSAPTSGRIHDQSLLSGTPPPAMQTCGTRTPLHTHLSTTVII